MTQTNRTRPKLLSVHVLAAVAVFLVLTLPVRGVDTSPFNWDFKLLTTPHGQPIEEVRDLLEDAEGALWVATWGGGLYRIYKTEWNQFTEADGFPGDWTRSLALGSDGAVWCATGDGLARIHDSEIHAYTLANTPDLPSENLTVVYWTSRNTLLVGTREGKLTTFTPDGPVLGPGIPLTGPPGSEDTRLDFLVEDHRGRLWGMWREIGLHRQETGGWQRFSTAISTEGMKIPPALPPDGALWVANAMGHEIYRIEGDDIRHLPATREPVDSIAFDENGTLYVGTFSGLEVFSGDQWEKVDLGRDVGEPDISKLLFTRDGAAWLGTREGLVRGAVPSWRRFERHSSGARMHALVAPRRDASVQFAVTDDQQLLQLDEGNWFEVATLAAHEHTSLYYHGPDEKTLWALSPSTLYQLSMTQEEVVHELSVAGLGDSVATRRLVEISGNRQWITSEAGVYEFHAEGWKPVPDFPGYHRRQTFSILETEPGHFWVALADGIERWTSDEIIHFGQEHGIDEGDHVQTICEARDGSIWFGTYGSGIYRYADGTFHFLSTDDGLASNSIHDIFEGSDGTIWIAYRRGGIGSWHDGRLVNFSHRNGLPNSEVYMLGADSEDHLWAATRNAGLVRYLPNFDPPETYMKASPRELPPGGAGIFSFYGWDAWNHTPVSDLLYSWRVTPAGETPDPAAWTRFAMGDAVAVPALAAGRYVFEVRAADGDRNVDEEPARAAFTVLAPFYAKPSFLIPIIVLAMLALTAVVLRHRAHLALRESEQALLATNRQLTSEIQERREIEKALEHHQVNLEALIGERTRELEEAQTKLLRRERLAALGQVTATISHELRNPLGTIKSSLFSLSKRLADPEPRVEAILSRADRSINRCSRIIDELLDFSRDLRLHRVPTDLNSWCPAVVEDLARGSEVAFNFPPTASSVTVSIDRDHLRRALINAIQNAVQALQEANTPDPQISISTGISDGRAYIRCEDNGPGIPAECQDKVFEPFFSTRGFGVGLGIPIMQDILHKHEGEVIYTSESGRGTTVTLWLPLPGSDAESSGPDNTAPEPPHAN